MLQQDTPRDYVIATGKTMRVRDFIEICFREIGIDIERR
jgi:GDPmannose 4,6-dehydratase